MLGGYRPGITHCLVTIQCGCETLASLSLRHSLSSDHFLQLNAVLFTGFPAATGIVSLRRELS